MAVFANGKIEAYVGPPGLGAADDLEAVIVDFIAGDLNSDPEFHDCWRPRQAAAYPQRFPRIEPEYPSISVTAPLPNGAICVRSSPCNRLLIDAEIAEFHPQVSDWEIVELDGINRLTRVYSFDDFAQALEFTNKVGELADEEGHHPALLTEWGRTTVTWWTHAIRGLHRNDFVMAAKTGALYQP